MSKKNKEKKSKKRMSKKKDGKLYATNNILALSLSHYDMCLKRDEKSEQLQELRYDRLERDEQEFLIGVMVEGKVTIVQDNDNNERLKAEVDMLDLLNFLGFERSGSAYLKIKELIERLMEKKVTKIVKRVTESGKIRYTEACGVIISDFKFDKRDDNKLYKLMQLEDFRRTKITIKFSETFSDVLLHDRRIEFFLRKKHIIKAIQKQPTYIRDVINYMIPLMGDIELDIYEVLREIYNNNAGTAKVIKQRLMKAYQEKEEVRNLFLACGLKIDVDNQKIVKRIKGLKDKDGAKVDPAFYLADSFLSS